MIPSMLKEEKYVELAQKDSSLRQYYVLQENGFWKAKIPEGERNSVKKIFINLGFSALNFTDSRSVFQFYNLIHLWDDIQIAIKNDLRLLHLATEPIRVSDLYHFLTGKEFVNELSSGPAEYDYRTCFGSHFGKKGKYLYNKEEIMKEIKEFVKNEN